MKRYGRYLGAAIVLAIVVGFAALSFGGVFAPSSSSSDTAVLWRNSIVAGPLDDVAVMWRNSAERVDDIAVMWRNSIVADPPGDVAVLWRNNVVAEPLDDVAVLWRGRRA